MTRPHLALLRHASRRLPLPPLRAFHTTPRLRNVPKSPFQVFVDTLKQELRKNQEMQENMRQLQGDVGKMQDSETMRKMREAYERARIVASIKENPRLQKAAEALRRSGGQVGDAVGATLRQMEESEIVKGLGAISSRLARQLEHSTAPIRNTEAYRQLSETLVEALDDGGSALRIYTAADADAATVRRIKREARLRKIGRLPPSADVDSAEAAEAMLKAHDEAKAAREEGEVNEKHGAEAEAEAEAEADKAKPKPRPQGYAVRTRAVTENAAAGQALVLRPEPAYKQAWTAFKTNNGVMRRLSELREAYDESENAVVERVRGVTEWVGGLFEETEFARVTRALQAMEAGFNLETFTRELREYVVPEIVDAYHGAQRHLLRQWCGEATFNLLMATVEPYTSKGLVPQGKLLDVKGVEVVQAKMAENHVPLLVVGFTSQELVVFKDPKTGEVAAGSEERAEMCRYAMVLTRVEEELDNEITGGWKVVEVGPCSPLDLFRGGGCVVGDETDAVLPFSPGRWGVTARKKGAGSLPLNKRGPIDGLGSLVHRRRRVSWPIFQARSHRTALLLPLCSTTFFTNFFFLFFFFFFFLWLCFVRVCVLFTLRPLKMQKR
ncbi:protein translocase subunit [Thecaphora frezii]